MFNFFKPKKIYLVKYKDNWGDYHCIIIEAINPAKVWKALCRGRYYGSPYYPAAIVSIKEIS